MATRVVFKGMYVFKGSDTNQAEAKTSVHGDNLGTQAKTI